MLSINTIKAMEEFYFLCCDKIILSYSDIYQKKNLFLHCISCVSLMFCYRNEGNGWKNKKSILILFSKRLRYLVLIGAFAFKAKLRFSSYTAVKHSCHHVQREVIRQKSHETKKTLYFSCGNMFEIYNYYLSFVDIISVDKYNYFVCHPLTNS